MAVVWCAAARALAAWLVEQEPARAPEVESEAPVVEPAAPGCPHAASLAPLARRSWIRHVVAPRERVDQIAGRYDVAVQDLRTWNGMAPETLRPKKGTRLRVRARRVPPARERIEYVVAEGDEWWTVARAHGVNVHDLKAYNWPYRGKMTPGTTLVVWSDPVVREWIAQDEIAEIAVASGGVGVGSPDAGWLLGGVRIPQGDGWRVRKPGLSYGTTHAVRELVRGLEAYREAYRETGGPLVELGAMSTLRGGEIGEHRSHQTGRDVDIGLPRRLGVPRGIPLTSRRVDWFAVWTLLESMAARDVDVMFLDYAQQRRVHAAALAAGVERRRVDELLQYPLGRASTALVRHADGHDLHVHVRFGCGPCEPECVDVRRAELPVP